MRVAESDGKRVGCIGRLGDHLEMEQRANHLLDLLFRSGAESGNAGLDFAGRITVRGNLRLRRGEQNDTPHFRKFEGRAHIERRENGFDGDGIWPELFDQTGDQEMNFAQTKGKSELTGEL